MKTHRHILFWLAMIFIALFIVPIAMPPEMARARIDREQKATAAVFGVASTNKLTRDTNSQYGVLVNDTGIGAFMDSFTTTEQQIQGVPISQDTQRNAGSTINRYMLSMTNILYGTLFRLNIVVHWLTYVGVFLLAAAVDGHVQRRIKYAEVAVLSPVQYSIAIHLLIAMTFVPILYMVLPLHISPWFMPCWALCAAFPLARGIANASGFD